MMLKFFRFVTISTTDVVKVAPFILFFVLFLQACQKNPYPGYDQTENGLYYKIVDGAEGNLPAEGDYLKVEATYATLSDSIIFDSRSEGMPIWIPISKSAFHGDIMEGLAMLSVGDSASFVVRADTFFQLTIGADMVPILPNNDSMMYVNIRVLDVKTQNEFAMEQEILSRELEKEYEALREKESSDLKEYLRINNITAKPEPSGLILMVEQPGQGPMLKAGQKVRVHYTGMLIDGQIFDSSMGAEPLEVVVGSPKLIDGFNEALQLLNVGAKATAIMPSSIAYGRSDMRSPIPPFATVIFDLKIVEAY